MEFSETVLTQSTHHKKALRTSFREKLLHRTDFCHFIYRMKHQAPLAKVRTGPEKMLVPNIIPTYKDASALKGTSK